jgi:hypothetical protein
MRTLIGEPFLANAMCLSLVYDFKREVDMPTMRISSTVGEWCHARTKQASIRPTGSRRVLRIGGFKMLVMVAQSTPWRSRDRI